MGDMVMTATEELFFEVPETCRVGGLLADLLGIQDDIAATVVWLADNWPGELPVPKWHGRGWDHEVLELLVYCSAGQLDQVAALVNTTPVDDPDPDSRWHCYQRVRRCFGTGRVALTAYTLNDDDSPFP
jgi:hypothetical protein